MPDFKAKMHQIRFPLGLCPRPRWGSLKRSADPLAVLKGPTSKGREVEGKGWAGKRWERGGEGRGVGGGREERGGREENEGVHLTHFAFRTLAALCQ